MDLVTVDVLAGVAWDPTIRGALVVLTGAAVLFGSVWVILSTNSGIRLGTLLTLAGFFGWMTIMAGYWWVTSPNAYKGDDPSWQAIDINRGDLGDSVLDEARELPDRDVLLADTGTPFEIVIASGDQAAIAEFTLDEAEMAEMDEGEIERATTRNEAITLSQVAAVSPEVIEDADLDFGGWTLLSTADAGEPQAAASAALDESEVTFPEGGFILLEAYDVGGKPDLPEDPNRWDRIRHYVTNSLRITHPTRYAIVQVQAVDQERLEAETVVGQPPAVTVVDEDAPVISVIMIRDLGNRRFPPAMVAIGSLLIFLVLCYVMHVRDKEMMRRRAEFEASEG